MLLCFGSTPSFIWVDHAHTKYQFLLLMLKVGHLGLIMDLRHVFHHISERCHEFYSYVTL